VRLLALFLMHKSSCNPPTLTLTLTLTLTSTLTLTLTAGPSPIQADAATMSLHWVYDQDEVKGRVGEDGDPTFLDPPANKYYTKALGTHSCYGDELQPLLAALAMGSQDDLAQPALHEAYYAYYKAYEGRLNHITKEFVGKRDAGDAFEDCVVEDSQANGFAKVCFGVCEGGGQGEGEGDEGLGLGSVGHNIVGVHCLRRLAPLCSLSSHDGVSCTCFPSARLVLMSPFSIRCVYVCVACTKVPFVVARFFFAGEEVVLTQVERAVASLQKGDATQAASKLAARVLLLIVAHGWDTKQAVEALLTTRGNELPAAEMEHLVAVKGLVEAMQGSQEAMNAAAKGAAGPNGHPMAGLSCSLPASVRNALAIAYICGADFVGGVNANALVSPLWSHVAFET
jgi:hypothetical protein